MLYKKLRRNNLLKNNIPLADLGDYTDLFKL